MAEAEARNMKVLSTEPIGDFAGIGEGIAMQIARDGRRILWLAHEGPPRNFTGVDVTDPRKPRVIVETRLPDKGRRSNSLDVSGDLMAVAAQAYRIGEASAGIELWDVSVPESPRSIAWIDCSGPQSRGVHCLWFCDGEFVHCSSGAADFRPRHPRDDQCYRIFDVRNPARPVEAGRWWLPGAAEGDAEPAPKRLYADPPGDPNGRDGFRAHNTNVYPDRPDRAYVGYLDGGAAILDISDKAHPRAVSIWNPHPPYPGFTHTALPLFDRDLMVVTDESIVDDGADWPKLTWVLDIRDERNPVPIATLPLPRPEARRGLGGRYGSHNLHENRPGPAFRSSSLVVGTYFNAGVRVHDISDAYRPDEVAFYVPPAASGSRAPATQINDVYVDENGIVYAVERVAGGLHILELEI